MDIYHSYGVHVHAVCDRYICAIKRVEKHNDDNCRKEEASPSLPECSGMPSGLFPHAGETRGSVVVCGMVSGTGVRKEKESNVQMVDPPPCFKLSTCGRLLSISSIAAGLRGHLIELDPDDMGEGPLDETYQQWAVAGEVIVCQLPLNNVSKCTFSWPDTEGSAEQDCERTTKASTAPLS